MVDKEIADRIKQIVARHRVQLSRLEDRLTIHIYPGYRFLNPEQKLALETDLKAELRRPFVVHEVYRMA